MALAWGPCKGMMARKVWLSSLAVASFFRFAGLWLKRLRITSSATVAPKYGERAVGRSGMDSSQRAKVAARAVKVDPNRPSDFHL